MYTLLYSNGIRIQYHCTVFEHLNMCTFELMHIIVMMLVLSCYLLFAFLVLHAQKLIIYELKI